MTYYSNYLPVNKPNFFATGLTNQVSSPFALNGWECNTSYTSLPGFNTTLTFNPGFSIWSNYSFNTESISDMWDKFFSSKQTESNFGSNFMFNFNTDWSGMWDSFFNSKSSVQRTDWSSMWSNFYNSKKSTTSVSTGSQNTGSFNYNKSVSGNIDNSYTNLSLSAARQKALTDTNLEELKGGQNWQIAEASFRTDIPFAKKGTGEILEKVAQEIGETLVITSALGTGEAGNPHQKGGYASHHNAENPKLDIRITGNAQELAQKLRDTGYFSRVSVESDHLDVQIDPAKFTTA